MKNKKLRKLLKDFPDDASVDVRSYRRNNYLTQYYSDYDYNIHKYDIDYNKKSNRIIICLYHQNREQKENEITYKQYKEINNIRRNSEDSIGNN